MVKFVDGVKKWQKNPSTVRDYRAKHRREDHERTPLTPKVRKFSSLVKGGDIALKGKRFIKATTATWSIISLTWILYVVQFFFAILSIVGLMGLMAIDGSWLDFLDIFGLLSDGGMGIAYISMVITFTMGVLTFLVALFVYIFRGVNFGRSHSVFVAAFCFCAYFMPGFNLFPWCWAWCLYVVKSQTK